MNVGHMSSKIKYLNKNRDILIFKMDDSFDVSCINSFSNIEYKIFDNNYIMIRYIEDDKEKICNKWIIKYNYECVYEDHNYIEAIRLLLKYISMSSQLDAKDVYQVGKMYLNVRNYRLAQGYLLLASLLCNSREYMETYQYCLSKLNNKCDYRRDLIDSDKLNLIIDDMLTNIGVIDNIIDKYELSDEEKLMVKIYLCQELYKYGDKKRAEKILLGIKKMKNIDKAVLGLLEYTEKNRAVISKKKKRELLKSKD